MTVEQMKELLRKEYGIRSKEELYKEIDKFDGVDIGLFTSPTERRTTDD